MIPYVQQTTSLQLQLSCRTFTTRYLYQIYTKWICLPKTQMLVLSTMEWLSLSKHGIPAANQNSLFNQWMDRLGSTSIAILVDHMISIRRWRSQNQNPKKNKRETTCELSCTSRDYKMEFLQPILHPIFRNLTLRKRLHQPQEPPLILKIQNKYKLIQLPKLCLWH